MRSLRLRKELRRIQSAVILPFRFLSGAAAVFWTMGTVNRPTKAQLFPSSAIAVPYWSEVLELFEPGDIEDCIVKKVVFLKFKFPSQHEAIIVEIWDRAKDTRKGWLRIERSSENVRSTNTQDTDSPAAVSSAEESGRPSTHGGTQLSESSPEHPRQRRLFSRFSRGRDRRSATEDEIPTSETEGSDSARPQLESRHKRFLSSLSISSARRSSSASFPSIHSSLQIDDGDSQTSNHDSSSSKPDADAKDIVQNWCDPDHDRRVRGAIVATIKYKGENIPTLPDLILAAKAVHNVEKRYRLLSHQCYWFADSILAILEHVAGPANFDVEFVSKKRIPSLKSEGKRLSQFGGRWVGWKVHRREEDALKVLIEEFGTLKETYQAYLNKMKEEQQNKIEDIKRPLVAQFSQVISKRDEVISKKDEVISKQGEEILKKDGEISEYKDQISEKNRLIAQLLAEREARTNATSSAVVEGSSAA